MRRLLTISALLALCATSASGQPQPLQPPAFVQPKPAEKKPDPADAAIAAALANDPDIKMAQAKIQLAHAELAKARQAATQRVLATQSALQDAKTAVLVAEQGIEVLTSSYKVEKITDFKTRPEYRFALAKLEGAKAKLAVAEAELKLLTGVAVAAPDVAVIVEFRQVERDVQFLDAIWERRIVLELKREAVKGPIPDRIRAALDKSVKLGAKGEKVTLAKALEVFKKDAGLDVPVREFGRVTAITTDGEELPVGAWFQLFADGNLDLRFLVREHGLLIAIKDQAPPDALGVVEFWKHKPTAAPESAPKK